MEKKQKLPRKQKRLARKIIIISLAIAGLLIGAGAGAYGFIYYKMNQPLYLSPLASAEFIKSTQNDAPVEQLRKGLQDAEIKFNDVKRSENATFTVTLESGSDVIFSSKKGIPSQIASLQYILSHLTMEDRQFKRLDLRYDKPIIVFK